jgi:hypothetical protein
MIKNQQQKMKYLKKMWRQRLSQMRAKLNRIKNLKRYGSKAIASEIEESVESS